MTVAQAESECKFQFLLGFFISYFQPGSHGYALAGWGYLNTLRPGTGYRTTAGLSNLVYFIRAGQWEVARNQVNRCLR